MLNDGDLAVLGEEEAVHGLAVAVAAGGDGGVGVGCAGLAKFVVGVAAAQGRKWPIVAGVSKWRFNDFEVPLNLRGLFPTEQMWGLPARRGWWLPGSWMPGC